MHAGVMLTAAFGLCACGGNVKNAETHEVESERYSQEEINAAIAVSDILPPPTLTLRGGGFPVKNANAFR